MRGLPALPAGAAPAQTGGMATTSQAPRRVKIFEEAVHLACRAPSYHNSQPWRWVVTSDSVQLFVDTDRLVATDTTGRQAVICCGAALDHVRVAAAANPDDGSPAASASAAPDFSRERRSIDPPVEPFWLYVFADHTAVDGDGEAEPAVHSHSIFAQHRNCALLLKFC